MHRFPLRSAWGWLAVAIAVGTVAACGGAPGGRAAVSTPAHHASQKQSSSVPTSAPVSLPATAAPSTTALSSTAATVSGPAPSPSAVPAADQAGSPWRIPKAAQGNIQGYASRASVAPGEQVTLYVSTPARSFRVRAFRMGWYRGRLARQTWLSAPAAGRQQPPPAVIDASTNTVGARWTPSITVSTAGWTPGDYLLRLESSADHMSFVPLTVRAPSAVGRVVLISPTTTWQAYNLWGCCDLYEGADGSFDSRSRAVTFDRPYAGATGADAFIHGELGVLAEAERLELPLDYVTDTDLQEFPHVLDGARAVVSMGHDEYWSVPMRATLTAARDAGTNLAFFGANAIYRRIRLEATPVGPARMIVNYKVASEDPLDEDGVLSDNPYVTADWPNPPNPDPESSLIGAQYGCFLQGAPYSAGVIVDPGNWTFAGVQVSAGEQLPGLIGPEVDAVQLTYPTPRPIEVLLHSPAACPTGVPATADTTYYVASSDAGVFDAGTIAWACAVDDSCYHPVSGPTEAVVRQVTDNVLRTFAAGPSGREHPATDNLAALHITG